MGQADPANPGLVEHVPATKNPGTLPPVALFPVRWSKSNEEEYTQNAGALPASLTVEFSTVTSPADACNPPVTKSAH